MLAQRCRIIQVSARQVVSLWLRYHPTGGGLPDDCRLLGLLHLHSPLCKRACQGRICKYHYWYGTVRVCPLPLRQNGKYGHTLADIIRKSTMSLRLIIHSQITAGIYCWNAWRV